MLRPFRAPTALCILALAVGSSAVAQPTESSGGLELVEQIKIWDHAPHNAFTDLIRFNESWFCAFREGAAHVSPDGALRVLQSSDGQTWQAVALIQSETMDLRDAKLSVTPGGQLMLAGAGAFQQEGRKRHQSLLWLSDDGITWSEGKPVADLDYWLWRVEWHRQKAYGFGYACGSQPKSIRFYSADDQLNFQTVIPKAQITGTYPNETGLLFLPDDTAYCLLRQDGEPKTGVWGTAKPPYTNWTWKPIKTRIGGPDMIQLPDGRILAAVRLYDRPVRTSLCWIDPESGQLTEELKLPSGGDTSYAGMVWHDNLLWVSYYSSHEGKTSIYLARVAVKARSDN